ELSPDNGCVIDMKWQIGPLSYHASAAGKEPVPLVTQSTRLPEIVLYGHVGFKGAYARTNLSFHYVGDFWNDRISCVIVESGVWRFYRDDYYKGPHWDLGPGYYESFFAEKGPDDVVSSFQCIALPQGSRARLAGWRSRPRVRDFSVLRDFHRTLARAR